MGMCVGAHTHTHKHPDTGNTHVYVAKVYDYFDAMCVSSGDSLKKRGLFGSAHAGFFAHKNQKYNSGLT